eukprot:3726436-Pyramimonas_sp.AAC.1
MPECQATGRHKSYRPATTSRGLWVRPIVIPYWLLTPSTIPKAASLKQIAAQMFKSMILRLIALERSAVQCT